MKIMRNPGYCKITFEENENYSGKTLRVEGDCLQNGFAFYPTTFGWYEKTEAGKLTVKPADASIRRELSDYIIALAEKEGYDFIEYALPGDRS